MNISEMTKGPILRVPLDLLLDASGRELVAALAKAALHVRASKLVEYVARVWGDLHDASRPAGQESLSSIMAFMNERTGDEKEFTPATLDAMWALVSDRVRPFGALSSEPNTGLPSTTTLFDLISKVDRLIIEDQIQIRALFEGISGQSHGLEAISKFAALLRAADANLPKEFELDGSVRVRQVQHGQVELEPEPMDDKLIENWKAAGMTALDALRQVHYEMTAMHDKPERVGNALADEAGRWANALRPVIIMAQRDLED